MDEAVTYAGFWVRVGATLIDALLIALVTMPIFVSVYGSGYFLSEEIVQGKVDFLLTWVLPAVAVITFWVLKSATPGKMVFFGGHCRCADGREVERSAVRWKILRLHTGYTGVVSGSNLGRDRQAQARVARQACQHGCYSQKARARSFHQARKRLTALSN